MKRSSPRIQGAILRTAVESTNILGIATAGADDPESFRPMRVRSSVLATSFIPSLPRPLWSSARRAVNYSHPAATKEGWDHVESSCGCDHADQDQFPVRDSFRAPLVLDLACSSTSLTRGMSGIQEWLSFYCSADYLAGDSIPRRSFIRPNLKNTLAI